MGNINYTIVSGAAPYTARLNPEVVEPVSHASEGTYQFTDLPDETYKLTITDSNECEFSTWVTVNPNVSTTTTTIAPNANSIVIGNSQDISLIFNEQGTNRNAPYVGYPDENIVELYLWFKTFDGKPLISNKILNINITSTIGSYVVFDGVYNEIYSEFNNNNNVGNSNILEGQLSLKKDIIETYIKYSFYKNDVNDDLKITINGSSGDIYSNLELVDETNTYGIINITNSTLNMDY